MKFKLLLCSAAALSSWQVAFAQENTEAEASEASRLDTIVVSAQRREQNILDVPVAVSTLTPAVMEAQQVDDVIDLNRVSPSVFSNNLSSPLSNAPIRIRGIGTGGGNPGFEGAVAVYIDEVFRSRSGAALTTFFDMAGVDVLRGPQGTLFGKNTTAGAILQRTQEPVYGEVGGYVGAEAAEYGSYEIEGAINIPLGETAALRFSGIYDTTDGFFYDPVNKRDTANSDVEGLRAQAKFDIGDSVVVRLVGDYSSWETPANYGRSTRIDNTDADGLQNAFYGQLALGNVAGPTTGAGYWYWDTDVENGFANPGQADPFSYNIVTNSLAEQDLDQYGLNGYVDFDLNDDITLRSITSYRKIDSINDNGDWEFGPTAMAGVLDIAQEFDTFSQEFLLEGFSEFGNISVDWVGGVHYFTEEIDNTREATVGPAWSVIFGQAPGNTTFGDPTYKFQNINYVQNEDSLGIFGHGTFNLTDTLSLIGGLRWNQIEKDITFTNLNGTAEEYHDQVATRSLGFYLANAALATAEGWDSSRTDEELTYNITLQWRPTDNTQLYANYSRGFKSGGFNMTENAAAGTPAAAGSEVINGRTFNPLDVEGAAFDPEFVDSYEIGFRWEYGGIGRLSLTGFYLDYSDLQVSVFNGQTFDVFNAGTSESSGIELENTIAVTDNLDLNIGATYLNAEYGDDVVSLPAGRKRGLSPDLSLVVGGSYERDITSNLNMYANATYSYYTEMFLAEGQCSDADGEPVAFGSECTVAVNPDNLLTNTQQDAYGVMVASIGLRTDSAWDVSVFCDNCFEEEYLTYAFNHTFHGNAVLGNPGSPRVFGARLRKTF